MVGGMWYPDADAEVENAFVPLDGDDIDISKAHDCLGRKGMFNSQSRHIWISLADIMFSQILLWLKQWHPHRFL